MQRRRDTLGLLISAGLSAAPLSSLGAASRQPMCKKENEMSHDDEFQLYDLKVEVFKSDDDKPMVCRHNVGDYFTLTDDDLISFPPDVKFPLYPLAAIIPLLPAKQRMLSPNDWMATDAIIACPDPNCGGRFRITREKIRTYRHSEQTVVSRTGN
jgi:uncharacterized repeat protein (TIGR04076 family)